MIDQYKRETSQIHAPAELIQKTRLAMQQEEQRLRESAQRAGGQDTAVGTQGETAADRVYKGHKSVHQIYKWTLPLSAAAAVLILVSVSAVMRSGKSGDSASDMTTDSGYENELDIENSIKPDRKDAEESSVDYAMAESADAAAEDMEPSEAVESTADEELEAAESMEDMESQISASVKELEESKGTDGSTVNEGVAGTEIEITEVDEEPDFYDDPDTECYLYENLLFWANQDESRGWFAYVGVRGDKYVIVSTIKDQEEFLEKAYELVKETRGSLK